MPYFDMPLVELRTYRPAREEPDDFDAFWQESLTAVSRHALNAQFIPVEYGLQTVETFDVTFSGFGGQAVKGWLLLPRRRQEPLPCVVEYLGYSRGRGFPTDWLLWSSVGFAHLVMDTRGQGWHRNNPGDTADIVLHGTGPHVPGFMTQGILDPDSYYYRRVFLDAVRAVDVARSHQAVDGERIAVTGASQGGGITLAVAGLVPDVQVAMPDVPFLCHFRRATELVDTSPYNEISQFCRAHRDDVETVFQTLSYFDGVNFAARAQAHAFFSVGLMDDICPPSTVFAAYNHYAGDKQMKVYAYNEHEGGGSYQAIEQVRFLRELWPAERDA